MIRASVLAALAMSGAVGPAWAQSFSPSRPVEIIVHSAPGGGSDVFAAITPFFDEQIDATRRTLREAGVAVAR